MPSIINALFSGRSGISSHGLAIASIGDNISNSSTIGYKRSRPEFEDLVAGGQAASKIIGSGSSISRISTIFEQGTLEFTGRSLDLSVDGNGFFVIDAASGERQYTRAGNFRVDTEGYVVNQKGEYVLGFPANGSGALERMNVNTISQSNVATTRVAITGNVDATTPIIAAATIPPAGAADTTTFADLSNVAAFSTVVNVFDSLGAKHTATVFFFHTGVNQYIARAYVPSDDVDAVPVANPGLARQIGTVTMTFNGSGVRNDALAAAAVDFTATPAWNNGASAGSIDLKFDNFTQFATSSNIQSITGDGNGVGAVTSLSIDRDGVIFALLDNGQATGIGVIGLANFANPEGLIRIGGNNMQVSTDSGEPIIGTPNAGTFGAIEAGSIELSTVDIASEFVKLITVQRGFQANARIITTVNQLLNEIIQLA